MIDRIELHPSSFEFTGRTVGGEEAGRGMCASTTSMLPLGRQPSSAPCASTAPVGRCAGAEVPSLGVPPLSLAERAGYRPLGSFLSDVALSKYRLISSDDEHTGPAATALAASSHLDACAVAKPSHGPIVQVFAPLSANLSAPHAMSLDLMEPKSRAEISMSNFAKKLREAADD